MELRVRTADLQVENETPKEALANLKTRDMEYYEFRDRASAKISNLNNKWIILRLSTKSKLRSSRISIRNGGEVR